MMNNMGRMKQILGTAVAALLVLAFTTGCDRTESGTKPETSQNQVRRVQVSVVTVEPSPMKDILVLPGETEACQDVRVGADTGGRVEWIGPKEGDVVKRGELIAQIDVASLKAALDKAEAALKLAEDLYERRLKLFDRKIINQEELDKVLTEQALAKASLRQAKIEYERGFIKAPISGVVNSLFVDQGEFVDRGKPVVDLVNVDKIKINVNVPELDVRYLKSGQQTLVRVDAFPDREMPGLIDFVAYKADPATKTFHVRVLVDNPSHDIRPGMIARVVFLRRIIADALSAPLFALVDKGGERLLFVEKEGVAHARSVTIGIIEGDRVQVTKGLNPGDRLIVTGQKEVEEGMKVQVR
jgi:membrane fusion protein (multidrug efflux system)